MTAASDLAREESRLAWELRGCWATMKEVGLSLAGRPKVRGYITYVAMTNAYALLYDGSGDLHIPLGRVQSILSPHFEESWPPPVAPPPPRPVREGYVHPNQLALIFP